MNTPCSFDLTHLSFAGTAVEQAQCLLRFVKRVGNVDDTIYKRVLDRFGEKGVVDLIAVNGYYDLVSMTLNVARVVPPAGTPLPLKSLADD